MKKKPTKKAAAKRTTAVELPAEAIEALDQLCDSRRIPGRTKTRRARAIMGLLLDALLTDAAAKAAIETKRVIAEAKRKRELSRLN